MQPERENQISPIVQDSVRHNTKTLTTLHNVTASLFGVGAGTLGLESFSGFIFYLLFSLLTSIFVYVFRVRPSNVLEASYHQKIDTTTYFRSSRELWIDGLVDGLSSYILTWTLFYGLIRA
ncbi:ER membrane protein complex subunit 6 [Erysiphe neolycopersici]|uniref:ER membrane protein complex subunit 6 n=1 Tax=Erysiphe neolycopersici TaxID=212602 RepID=A0A420HHU9_9PEZI|nr:ER membrane protein complex subunit 6 [Erysiphe neolycopersici]